MLGSVVPMHAVLVVLILVVNWTRDNLAVMAICLCHLLGMCVVTILITVLEVWETRM
jgi:hypothetical protein